MSCNLHLIITYNARRTVSPNSNPCNREIGPRILFKFVIRRPCALSWLFHIRNADSVGHFVPMSTQNHRFFTFHCLIPIHIVIIIILTPCFAHCLKKEGLAT